MVSLSSSDLCAPLQEIVSAKPQYIECAEGLFAGMSEEALRSLKWEDIDDSRTILLTSAQDILRCRGLWNELSSRLHSRSYSVSQPLVVTKDSLKTMLSEGGKCFSPNVIGLCLETSILNRLSLPQLKARIAAELSPEECSTVETLNLNSCSLDDSDMSHIVQVAELFKNLRIIDISHNRLTGVIKDGSTVMFMPMVDLLIRDSIQYVNVTVNPVANVDGVKLLTSLCKALSNTLWDKLIFIPQYYLPHGNWKTLVDKILVAAHEDLNTAKIICQRIDKTHKSFFHQ